MYADPCGAGGPAPQADAAGLDIQTGDQKPKSPSVLHIKRTAVRKDTTKSTFIDARARATRPNHVVRIHATATAVPVRYKARAVS